jgi:hypothetical protein
VQEDELRNATDTKGYGGRAFTRAPADPLPAGAFLLRRVFVFHVVDVFVPIDIFVNFRRAIVRGIRVRVGSEGIPSIAALELGSFGCWLSGHLGLVGGL